MRYGLLRVLLHETHQNRRNFRAGRVALRGKRGCGAAVDVYKRQEEAFCAGGLKITAKLLAEALHTLPDEKRQAVLLLSLIHI